ncbi:hypothetical protein [Aeromicrobium sp. UC242_57]|uniref:hypothetical protein n=1 Tax=Aeromicrobium sp. UC242_57 TaxID=3374624 RepID=UPI003798B510
MTIKAGQHSARFAWTPVSGATSYTVCLLVGQTATPCGKCYAGLTSPAAHATSLTPRAGTDYHVLVRAFKGTTAGPWSAEAGFNLTAATPTETRTVPQLWIVHVEGARLRSRHRHEPVRRAGCSEEGRQYRQDPVDVLPGRRLTTKSGSIRVLISQDTTDAVEIVGASGLKFHNVRSGKKNRAADVDRRQEGHPVAHRAAIEQQGAVGPAVPHLGRLEELQEHPVDG